jgi:hypothetical protein
LLTRRNCTRTRIRWAADSSLRDIGQPTRSIKVPRTFTIQAYDFEELSGKAKETARQWYRETGLDYAWHDTIFEDFGRICEILGVLLKTAPVRLSGGGTLQKPCIFFSGFWSQGDGACFEGDYAYARGAHGDIRTYAPQDSDLHDIADRLRDVQRCNFYQLHADVTHIGRYYHEYTMTIGVERAGHRCREVREDDEEAITEALRDLARWLYRALKREYDYLSSDEAVDEAIIANGYSFSEAGGRSVRLH